MYIYLIIYYSEFQHTTLIVAHIIHVRSNAPVNTGFSSGVAMANDHLIDVVKHVLPALHSCIYSIHGRHAITVRQVITETRPHCITGMNLQYNETPDMRYVHRDVVWRVVDASLWQT